MRINPYQNVSKASLRKCRLSICLWQLKTSRDESKERACLNSGQFGHLRFQLNWILDVGTIVVLVIETYQAEVGSLALKILKGEEIMPLTHEEATTQAVQLRKQGLTFAKIAKHLQDAGYVSAKTKKPVTDLTVRLMVGKVLDDKQKETKKDERAEKREHKKETKIMLSSPAQDATAAIQSILALPSASVSEPLKIRMIQMMITEKMKNLDVDDGGSEKRTVNGK